MLARHNPFWQKKKVMIVEEKILDNTCANS